MIKVNNKSTYDIKVYHVKNCKVSNKYDFTGCVLNVDDEPIIESIKRKLGLKGHMLLCEMTNEGFDYDIVDLFKVPLSELSLGDILLLDSKIKA